MDTLNAEAAFDSVCRPQLGCFTLPIGSHRVVSPLEIDVVEIDLAETVANG